MPVIVEWTFEDELRKKQTKYLFLFGWLNEYTFTQVFIKDKEVAGIRVDPYRETADIEESNNMWAVKELLRRFQLFKEAHRAMRGASTEW